MKNNFTKNFALFIIAIVFIPNFVLAAWWNPFSWIVFSLLKYENLNQEVSSTTQIVANSKTVLTNTEIINLVKPAAVFIETSEGRGSGMIIDSSGYVLTNAHVVEGIDIANVKLSDGQSYLARVEGRDETYDVAILIITSKQSSTSREVHFWDSITKNDAFIDVSTTSLSEFSHVTLGNSDAVYQGEEVFSLGYPFGLEGDVSFKEGTISRRITTDEGMYLETSAEIHPGNSGGPLVNRFGEVIGITSGGIGDSVNDITIGETIKLAIPINVAKKLIPDLRDGKEVLIKREASVSSQKPQSSPTAEISSVLDSGIFQMKSQCAILGQQKKVLEDNEYLNGGVIQGGTVSYAYSPKLNTCIYARLYTLYLRRPTETYGYTGKIVNLLTTELIHTKKFIVAKELTDPSTLEKTNNDFWTFYDSLI